MDEKNMVSDLSEKFISSINLDLYGFGSLLKSSKESDVLLCSSLQRSIAIVEKALDSFSSIALSFNGGKDSVVMLYIIYCVLKSRDQTFDSLVLFRFIESDPFDEMEVYLEEMQSKFSFKLISIPSSSFKSGLSILKDRYSIDAVFVGVRFMDPYGSSLSPFSPTTSGWPSMIRIHPVLYLSYSEIWRLLRFFDIPYCSLYDDGYTSIGDRSNSIKNPSLFDSSSSSYLPAYMLSNEDDERLSRVSK
mmetsp:Transcript_987/g.1542  ORF Transcript_987/g.1542 Transcript_987/m.1542 type:complete len:247 (-) Transcript_987:82-822(-)